MYETKRYGYGPNNWYLVWQTETLTVAQEQEAQKRANDTAYDTINRAWLRLTDKGE